MNEFRYKPAAFLLLITAFLAVQWSSAHIHLAGHRNHDENHQRHDHQGLPYHLTNHHPDEIDASPGPLEGIIVELDQECGSHRWNEPDDHPDISIPVIDRHLATSPCTPTKLTGASSHVSSWLDYSAIRLRAPPHITS